MVSFEIMVILDWYFPFKPGTSGMEVCGPIQTATTIPHCVNLKLKFVLNTQSYLEELSWSSG